MDTSATRFLQHENSRLREESEALQRQVEGLNQYFLIFQELYWASQYIAAQDDPLHALGLLLQNTIRVIGAKDGSLTRLDADNNELEFMLVHGDLQHNLSGFRIKSDRGIAGWVIKNRKPIIVNEPRQDWRFSRTVDEQFGFLTQSIVTVPILKGGEIAGAIQFLNKAGGFTEADVAVMLHFGQVAVTVLDAIGERQRV